MMPGKRKRIAVDGRMTEALKRHVRVRTSHFLGAPHVRAIVAVMLFESRSTCSSLLSRTWLLVARGTVRFQRGLGLLSMRGKTE